MSKRSYAQGHRVDHEEGEPDSYYPTFPAATEALLRVEQFEGSIWEPACGEGAISDVLIAAGYEVISTDLVNRGYGAGGRDFLREWESLAPNIVTNPPFHLAQQFCNCALQMTSGKVAMFLRLAFLEGTRRKQWFERTPLARMYVMSRRVPMERAALSTEEKGHGVLAFAWFVWEHGFVGDPTVHFLDWKTP